MRRVLITGASSGIGQQLAQDYADEGWKSRPAAAMAANSTPLPGTARLSSR